MFVHFVFFHFSSTWGQDTPQVLIEWEAPLHWKTKMLKIKLSWLIWDIGNVRASLVPANYWYLQRSHFFAIIGNQRCRNTCSVTKSWFINCFSFFDEIITILISSNSGRNPFEKLNDNQVCLVVILDTIIIILILDRGANLSSDIT